MKLSVCMMVKDEGHNLYRCLESIKDIADEIIIVDTGSTDNTMDIARQYTEKIYEHPWESNFSLHRNQSINYATGDAIFILDADEEVVLKVPPAEFKEHIADLINRDHLSVSIEFIDIQNEMPVMNFNSHRIFKAGNIHYEGIVHNKAVFPGEQSIHITNIQIKHYGYDMGEEMKQKKYKRTKGLLEKRLENPDDYEAYFYLAQLEAVMGHHELTIQHASSFIAATEDKDISVQGSIYFTAYRSAFELGQFDIARSFLEQRVAKLTKYDCDIDIAFGLVELGMKIGDFELIEKGISKYLQLYNAISNDELLLNSFTFTFNTSALFFVLYGAVIMNAHTTVNHIKNFEAIRPKVDEKYAGELADNVNANFDMLGLPPMQDILFKGKA